MKDEEREEETEVEAEEASTEEDARIEECTVDERREEEEDMEGEGSEEVEGVAPACVSNSLGCVGGGEHSLLSSLSDGDSLACGGSGRRCCARRLSAVP